VELGDQALGDLADRRLRMATPGPKRVCSTPTRSKLQAGIEMLKGQFNRVAVREQLFAIFFPNQRSLPLKIFERFFFPLVRQVGLLRLSAFQKRYRVLAANSNDDESLKPYNPELSSDGGETDYDLRRVGVNIDWVLRKVAGAQIALHAEAPGANEGEIKHATDY
jgi:hypothetical protein